MKSAKGILSLVVSCLILQFVLCGPQSVMRAAVPTTQFLSDGWQLARVPDVVQNGDEISLASFDSSSWISAVVPGTALTSYQTAGVIADPYFGTNMAVLCNSGFYDTYYWYRDVFNIPSSFSGQNIFLNFDAINWKADIYVNGAYVESLSGPFKSSAINVTSFVNPGTSNCVAVMLHWSNATVYDAPTFIGADSWDFMPAIAGREVGLYQNVYLTTSGPVNIVDPFITTTLPLPDTSPASLTLRVQLTNSSASTVSGVLSGAISPDEISFQTNLTINPFSATNYTFSPGSLPQLLITNPALWWPNGYGPQNLHNLQLSFLTGLGTSDVQNVSFGIRQYSYNTNGHDLQLSCNGQNILCKGGNWGIADAMLKYTPAQLDTAVRLHQQMNFTMIRCWHGNSDLDAFYDACDKYGIMVWDEFWLNGSQFGLAPADIGMFETNAVDKIERLRNRACLAVWCGENEATPPAPLNTFLPQAISQLDGTRIYFQASNAGGIHGGGPYSFQGPLWYFQNAHGFTTEIGLPSVPVVESMEAMMPAASLWPLGDTNWLYHNWAADIGNKGLPQYTNAVSSEYGAATGIADFCEKAQLLNLENYKAIFEGWNAQLFNPASANPNSGVLLWMSQPAWPSLIWQTYDWYFDLGGAYFGCKKACEPVHIQWDCDDNSVRVINATAGPFNNLHAAIQVYNLDGTLVYSTNLTGISPAANSVTNCFALFNGIGGLSSVHFVKLKLSDDNNNLLSENFYWRGTNYLNYSALDSLPSVSPAYSANYTTTNGTTTITASFTNSSAGVIFGVRLKLLNETTGLRVLPAFYSDNYFSLVPGDARTITVEFTNGPSTSGPLQLMLSGWNTPTQQVLALTVSPAVPTISAPVVIPADSVSQGTAVSLVCSNYSGSPPYGFQWQASANGGIYTNVNAATANMVALTNATLGNSGYYRLIFTANGQSVTSAVAPLTVTATTHSARLSIKFAADKDYGYDAINNGVGTGPLNSEYWFNFYGPDGGSAGFTNVPFYASNNVPQPSKAILVYNWAGEVNYDNEQATVPNDFALMDSFISVNNNGWYLSVTNLDPVFTNSYSVYFYYFGGNMGFGGQNYVRYYAGQTTNSTVRGLRQWNLYTTTTNNDGHFTADVTPSNTGVSGETPGANYIVFTNLSGGAFDLLITNGNYGGINAMEIVANPQVTTSALSVSTNAAAYGTTLTFTTKVSPAPPDGELIMMMDGTMEIGSATLSGGVATFSSSSLGLGTNQITAVYAGDVDYLPSVSNIVPLTVTAPPSFSITCTPVGGVALRISWESVPQQIYQVESRTNLMTGTWITNTAVQANSATTSALVFMASDQEYFRISASY